MMIVIILLLSFHLNCILVSGSSFSDKVYQTPANIYTNGEDAKISCSHNISSYNQILWYKQSKKQLELLGYMVLTGSNAEAGLNVVMEGSASQGKNCTLTIKEIKLNSSGVYFCAASYHSSAHR
ncbi:unnamed protein product [Oreochromis niloticus]|nr:unnamed protein product [Mustela putorius furo]